MYRKNGPGGSGGAGRRRNGAYGNRPKSAVSAGATFIVTPGFSPKVVSWCVEHQIDVIPGITSPSDVEQAMEFGLSVCKFSRRPLMAEQKR